MTSPADASVRERLLLGVLLAALLGVAGWSAVRREPEVRFGRFVTSLAERTPNQAHNVALAARTIHGKWLAPGAVFSFNRAVGSWSSASGYRLAPVSYDGELVPSWGGGICQASTTLYNAALLAGMEILERHRHHWHTGYVAPGRDAAVAYSNIDLRFRNPHAWPVQIRAAVRGEMVEFAFSARQVPESRVELRQALLSVAEPARVEQPWHEGMLRRRVRNPGKRGCRVLTYRRLVAPSGEVREELLSDDTYPAMNRLLLTGLRD